MKFLNLLFKLRCLVVCVLLLRDIVRMALASGEPEDPGKPGKGGE